MTQEEIHSLVINQRKYFLSNNTKNIDFRIETLKKIKKHTTQRKTFPMLIIITSMFLIVKEKYTRCMYTTRGQTKFLTFYLYF